MFIFPNGINLTDTLSISSINAMWKNEHLSPIPKHFTMDLSARGVKLFQAHLLCANRFIVQNSIILVALIDLALQNAD